MLIYQTAGSNANDILTEVNSIMERVKKIIAQRHKSICTLFFQRISGCFYRQSKGNIDEAFVLVFIVVFIFLQDFRSTLIPAIAVPVAIIGTFFFMQLFGFTINLLTLVCIGTGYWYCGG